MQVQHADYPFRRHGYICIKNVENYLQSNVRYKTIHTGTPFFQNT